MTIQNRKSSVKYSLRTAPVTSRGGGADEHGREYHRARRRHSASKSSFFWNATSTCSLPSWTGSSFKALFGFTVAIYILNQKALLPIHISAVVSKVLFWPTLPITVARRVGHWRTVVDETVVMGGAPFGFAGIPESLYEEYGVRGVVNLCDEYKGPTKKYKELGITQLHLPTVDHFTPNVSTLFRAVNFIQKHKDNGERVYVHCRAGHGRSAAAVFAWLLYKDPRNVDLRELNQQFTRLRNVKSTLWRQPSIVEFHSRLLNGEEPIFEHDDENDE